MIEINFESNFTEIFKSSAGFYRIWTIFMIFFVHLHKNRHKTIIYDSNSDNNRITDIEVQIADLDSGGGGSWRADTCLNNAANSFACITF